MVPTMLKPSENLWFLQHIGVVMVRPRLQQERIKRGLSYRDVADAIGLTERAVRYLEDGQRDPSWGTAQKLAKLFEVPAEELLVQDSTPDSETA